ncbi:MAG: class I SAM-dependent methyltransferase [Sphingobacteriaceae bacterium]|nr:class I SAM-dependent methyltransferase [Sphingobacteriaceae bacterium]
MLAYLNKQYKLQQFQPAWYSLFINPFYIIRKALFTNIQKLAPHLGGGRLLDFGCGAKPYRSLFEVTEYLGLDMENPGHPHLTEEVDVFYDGKTIPFENNSFDAVLSSEVLEHVFEPESTLREINRVLKPGAMGLFTVPFVWNEHETPYDYGRYSAFGITHLMQKSGFEIVELHRTTHFIETWLQLGILYLYQLLETRNKYINILLTTLFISPFNLLAVVLSKILPRNHSFYFNLVVLVRKMP